MIRVLEQILAVEQDLIDEYVSGDIPEENDRVLTTLSCFSRAERRLPLPKHWPRLSMKVLPVTRGNSSLMAPGRAAFRLVRLHLVVTSFTAVNAGSFAVIDKSSRLKSLSFGLHKIADGPESSARRPC
jgi:hypothetical protein